MTQSGPSDRPTPELVAALEAELLDLRAGRVQVDRDRAAIERERAAMDRERAVWERERQELQRRSAGSEPSAPVAERTRITPRHVLGTLAHKSALVRRLRDGRGPRPG